MGNNHKSRSKDAKITVDFEQNNRTFSADNPINGIITIDSKVTIPAYCVQAAL